MQFNLLMGALDAYLAYEYTCRVEWHKRSALLLRNCAYDWSREEQVRLLQWAKQVQGGNWKAAQQSALAQWIETQMSQRLIKHWNRKTRVCGRTAREGGGEGNQAETCMERENVLVQ